MSWRCRILKAHTVCQRKKSDGGEAGECTLVERDLDVYGVLPTADFIHSHPRIQSRPGLD